MSRVEEYSAAMEIDVVTNKVMQKFSVSSNSKATAVVPSDTTVIPATKGLYVGVAGDVSVVMADGSAITFKALAAGVIHKLSVTEVKATGTTATDIVALY